MLVEPAVDRDSLIAAVHQYYGLTVASLEFVPVGWGTAGYKLRAGDSQYFLKLWPDGREAAGALDRLPFVQQLHAHGLRVPYPLATRENQLSVQLPSGVIALFPFLAGSSPPDWPVCPRSVLEEIGRTIGQLHAIPLDLPFREEFAVRTREQLRPYVGGEVLRPYETELSKQLDRLDELQQQARLASGPFVVTHTDLIGNNILVDDEGQVSVLDWDDMRLAPPEYDLSLLLHGVQPVDGRALATVLEVYPVRPLRIELFAFFLLRRALDDFTARIFVLSEGERTPHEIDDAREGLELWGAEQWRHLDRRLDLIRSALPETLPGETLPG
jgi:Ser/Thr protein kinase RdoA (MazF antagonist)